MATTMAAWCLRMQDRSTALYVYPASMVPTTQKKRGALVPARDELMALVEPSDVGGHWHWLGDVMHEALQPWPAFKRDGNVFIVIRLLLELKPRERLKNKCGLRTCVNPEHWEALSRGG